MERRLRRLPVLLAVASLPLIAQRPPQPQRTEQEQAIYDKLRTLRKIPDDQRAEITRELAVRIRQLPPSAQRANLTGGLASLSTEGDFGQNTLQEVARTIAEVLRSQPEAPQELYEELAQLVRYEHVEAGLDAAPLKAALAKLEADDRQRSAINFTLTDLSGRSWTLKDLKGKVVLVNFWATWCPPCRKEMPDLEALYTRFRTQGLVILGISDEELSKVQPFIGEHKYSFPILLDPGRRVHEQFGVNGIPKTFVYDREGKLAAQAIDMRTQKQFLALLAQAGLK